MVMWVIVVGWVFLNVHFMDIPRPKQGALPETMDDAAAAHPLFVIERGR